ncbi:26166_t:CDS:2, partial [Gigaspora rosea]
SHEPLQLQTELDIIPTLWSFAASQIDILPGGIALSSRAKRDDRY